jgi:hypothetical protein
MIATSMPKPVACPGALLAWMATRRSYQAGDTQMPSKQVAKALGIVLAVIGVGLLIWGYQMSDSVGNELSKTFTGSSTDGVMYRYIGGAASLLVGLFFLFRK